MTDIVLANSADICAPYRAEIDEYDLQIAHLVALRALTARELGERKREAGLGITNPGREAEVSVVYEDAAIQQGLPKEIGSTVAGAVIEVCRGIQISDSIPTMYASGAIDH